MTRSSDTTALAERFLRLWEDSWQQMAQDPEIARYWSNLFAAMQQSTFKPPVAADTPTRYSYEHDQPDYQTHRSAPAAAAPVDRGDRIDELTRRVRELERTVAELAATLRQRPGRRPE